MYRLAIAVLVCLFPTVLKAQSPDVNIIVHSEARPNDNLDDTAAIQEVINLFKESKRGGFRGNLVLPSGVWNITTLDLTNVTGMVVVGSGGRGAKNSSDGDVATVLRSSAGTGAPALRMRGVNSCVFRNIRIENEGGDCVHYLTETTSTGRNQFHNVCFYGNNGFEAGIGGQDLTASDVEFYTCQFQTQNVGFRTWKNQSVIFNFYGCTFQWIDRALVLNRGGIITMTGCSTYGVNYFLTINGGGSNTGVNTITGLKLDNHSRFTTVLDTTSATGSWSVEIHGVAHVSGMVNAPGRARFELGSRGQLLVTGARTLEGAMVYFKGSNTKATIMGCAVAEANHIHPGSYQAPGPWVFNSYGSSPDWHFANRIEDYYVIHTRPQSEPRKYRAVWEEEGNADSKTVRRGDVRRAVPRNGYESGQDDLP